MKPAVTVRQEILRLQGEELAVKLNKEADWISKSLGREDLTERQFIKLKMQSELILSVVSYLIDLKSDWEECYGWLNVLQIENKRLKSNLMFNSGRAKFHQKEHMMLRKGLSKAFKQLSGQIKEIEADYENRRNG